MRSTWTLIPVAAVLAASIHWPSVTATDLASPSTAAPAAAVNDLSRPIDRDTEKKVERITTVFEEIMTEPKSRIPRRLLEASQGIVIIPSVLRAGFIFGGTRGTGVMMLRDPGGPWSNPAFVNITSGSLGLQIGAKSSDIVMIFKSRDVVNQFMTGSFRLGGSVAGALGPLESTPVTSASGFGDTPVYTYARSSGIFGGVSLEGAKLGFNSTWNSKLYGRSLSPRQIFNDPFIPSPPVVDSLKDALKRAEAGVLRRF
jgi:SH3 domain-containing YSC84-like protein 1